ncbi:MAG TPA: amidohydrolase family protein [Euzebyales bacterium]|nr:amidohydrolase family protein [Euzebyales bacterium]
MLITCTMPTDRATAPAGRGPAGSGGPVVDIHCHVLTPAAEELIAENYSREQIVAHEPYERYAGVASAEHNASVVPELRPKLTDPATRIRDMDAMGVDIQVLATFVSQFYYWTDPELGQRIARVQNERLATIRDGRPDRFAAIGTVPMQDASRAVAELEHVVGTLGFNGVQISSNIDGADLDDPRSRRSSPVPSSWVPWC